MSQAVLHGGEARNRVEALDLLRLVAVLAVVFFHYAFRGAAADDYTAVSLPDLADIAKYGYLGVQFFFVISGFVIAYSAQGRTSATFAIARVSRIYPAFLLCMTLTFLASLTIGGPRFHVTFGQWIANLFIVAPALKQPFMDGAYWSIVYEITFYGWVALLIWLGVFRRGIDWIAVVWLALSLANEIALDSGAVRRLLLTDQSGFFVAGLLLYEIYAGRRDLAVKLLLVTATIVAIDQACVSADWTRSHYHVTLDNGVIAAVCLASVAAVGLATRVRRLPFSAGAILALGGLTYPLYLLHQHIGFMLLNRFDGAASPALLIAATTAAMLVFAWALWRLAEQPAQRWTKATLTGLATHFGRLCARMRAAIGVVIERPGRT